MNKSESVIMTLENAPALILPLVREGPGRCAEAPPAAGKMVCA